MWPETPCKMCGTPTIDEGGLCSDDCHTQYAAVVRTIVAGGAEPTLAQLSSEPVGLNPMDDPQPDDAATLLDEIVPEFIEFVKEYHLRGWTESRDEKKCHLCQKLAKAEAYLDARRKEGL